MQICYVLYYLIYLFNICEKEVLLIVIDEFWIIHLNVLGISKPAGSSAVNWISCAVWKSLSSFVYTQEGSIHRKRASFLDPNNTGTSLLAYFKMISGFLLDPMHMIDGGVLKDFLKLVCDRLGEIVPGMGCKQRVRVNKRLKQWIRVFNKTKILEICKFRLDELHFKNYWSMGAGGWPYTYTF